MRMLIWSYTIHTRPKMLIARCCSNKYKGITTCVLDDKMNVSMETPNEDGILADLGKLKTRVWRFVSIPLHHLQVKSKKKKRNNAFDELLCHPFTMQ